MRFLKTNTATRVTVGPFFDKTDGVTPEVAITVTACNLTFMVDTGGVPTLVLDTAPTASGGANDMVHVTNDDAGFYDLELAAANVNYVGRAMLALTDAATHCPVFHEFMILPALVYDSLVGGTDNLQVDTIQVGGTTQTARDIGASVLLSSGSGAGQLDFTSGVVKSNLTQMGGVAQSATDLKDFADTGYDPVAHKIAGVVLADTLTTYTGNTVQTGDSYALANGANGFVAIKADTAAILVDTGTTLDTKINSIQGATFDTATDSLEALRNRGDAAWITATGFSTHSAAAVAALVLATPANLLVTDATGGVNLNLSQSLSALTGYPTTVGGSLYFIRQLEKNKLVYDKAGDTMVLYDDNGTTAKGTHTMTDDASTATRGAAA